MRQSCAAAPRREPPDCYAVERNAPRLIGIARRADPCGIYPPSGSVLIGPPTPSSNLTQFDNEFADLPPREESIDLPPLPYPNLTQFE